MVLGDYRRNRRKTAFVATGELFSAATVSASSQDILRDVIVVDPLTASDTSSGVLKFTAPYSRFYQIRLVAAFNDVAVVTSYVPSFFSTVDERLGTRVGYLGTALLVNGAPTTTGVLQTTGDASLTYQVNLGVLTLNEPGIYSDSETNTTIWLESGDSVSFQYSFTLQQLYTKDTYQGKVTDATAGLGSNGSMSLTGAIPGSVSVADIDLQNLIFTFTNQPSTKLADLSLSAAYYLEIFELDRE